MTALRSSTVSHLGLGYGDEFREAVEVAARAMFGPQFPGDGAPKWRSHAEDPGAAFAWRLQSSPGRDKCRCAVPGPARLRDAGNCGKCWGPLDVPKPPDEWERWSIVRRAEYSAQGKIWRTKRLGWRWRVGRGSSTHGQYRTLAEGAHEQTREAAMACVMVHLDRWIVTADPVPKRRPMWHEMTEDGRAARNEQARARRTKTTVRVESTKLPHIGQAPGYERDR